MTAHRTSTASRVNQSLVECVRQILDDPTAPVEIVAGDVELRLLEAATAAMVQFQMIGGRCGGSEFASRIVVAIVDHAESLQIASSGAIGVVGSLVGHLCDADEAKLAHVLTAARHGFDEDDLIAGAVALLVATTVYFADVVGTSPLEAHDEVQRALAGAVDRERQYRLSTCGRRFSA